MKLEIVIGLSNFIYTYHALPTFYGHGLNTALRQIFSIPINVATGEYLQPKFLEGKITKQCILEELWKYEH